VDVPPHLRKFVVEQDYARYTAVDRAVWRFLALQIQARLVETAHPAYRDGLAATGISPERIPVIAEVSDKLSRFGWRAVCVDGFVPPRAFQEFQANGLLPIAAEVRSREHLVYTPAPDIFHEAAGHAPILPEPSYAAYLRRIGDLGRRAFTRPEEARLDDVIHELSDKKEDPSLSPTEVARVEAELAEIVRGLPAPSEAVRLSRLYWWTVEYGLVGRVDDYKLYGAGLLSSLGESHSCHAPDVRKLPLDEGCMDVAYDITRPQPQLFVTPTLEALHDVLDRAARQLATTLGGRVALERALASRELASATFSSGATVMGVLADAGPELDAPAWVVFEGPVALAWDGVMRPEHVALGALDGLVVPTGPLADGAALDGAGPFRFASGVVVEGRVVGRARHADGRLMHVELADARVSLPGRAPLALPRTALVAAGAFVGAHAGAADARALPDTSYSGVRVPKPRTLGEPERRMLGLFERAERAHAGGATAVAAEFPALHAALERDEPREWLLRWNLLESLLKLGDGAGPLARTLRAELERLEDDYDHAQPIASGLRYLSLSHP
jgi:phenylalanine-4-hydroxylase